jgi:hypothetical protein
LAKRKSRKDRIAALGASQEAELGRERDELGLGRYEPSVPADLQIPTKIVRGELQADLEDEYFGGFGESDCDEQEREAPSCPGDVPGCDRRWCEGWGWGWIPRPYPVGGDRGERQLKDSKGRVVWLDRISLGKSPWGRVWHRAESRSPRRWAAEQHESGGLVDGQTPPMHQFLKSHAAWPKFRTYSLPNRAYESPHLRQAVRQAEQKLPAVAPEDEALDKLAERGRAEGLERLARRLELLTAPTDPNSEPSRSFARGILHKERAELFVQHTERRVQALFTRRYRPSRALEDKRLPKLPKIKTKLLPKEELGKAERRIAMRAEQKCLVETYLAQGGSITQCPAEKTTRMLNKWPVGRPPIGERAMTAAERQQRKRHREKIEIITATAQEDRHDNRNKRHHVTFDTSKLDRGPDCVQPTTE